MNRYPLWKYLVLGAAFSAMSVMTKGVFTLITITSGLVCMWLYLGQWRKLWSAKWLLAAVLTCLFMAPELMALYLQFDVNPQKNLLGQDQVSGIRFFLWDSQLGRFFKSGVPSTGESSPLYFVHVFLWAFMPWVLAFVATAPGGLPLWTSQSAPNWCFWWRHSSRPLPCSVPPSSSSITTR